MRHTRHLSRRVILNAIPVLGAGSLLLPVEGQWPDARPPVVINGALLDRATGRPVAAKLRVVETGAGQVYFPEKAIRTRPERNHYFCARVLYEVALPPGWYRIEAEVGSGITRALDLRIPVLRDLREDESCSESTNTRYHLDIDEDPDERLRLAPPAEDLDVSVISYLIRSDSPYLTNRYPVGRLPQFSRDGKAPDFPTLSMLCAEAQKIGGTTVWCHNGAGMEMPVVVALGQVDAYNLGDGLEAAYDRYCQFLNCGLRLPARRGPTGGSTTTTGCTYKWKAPSPMSAGSRGCGLGGPSLRMGRCWR